MIGLMVCFVIVICMVDMFWCGKNVLVNWDLNGDCSVFELMEIVCIDWGMNIILDVLSM